MVVTAAKWAVGAAAVTGASGVGAASSPPDVAGTGERTAAAVPSGPPMYKAAPEILDPATPLVVAVHGPEESGAARVLGGPAALPRPRRPAGSVA